MRHFLPDPGAPGYIRKKKRQLGLILLLFAAAIFLIIFLCFIITGTKNNIGTLTGVLLVLPAAKFAVSWLMLLPYQSIDAALYEAAAAQTAESDRLMADLVLTRYEGRIHLPLILIRNGHIFAAAPRQKMNKNLIIATLKDCIPGKDESKKTVRLFEDGTALIAWMQKNPGPGADAAKDALIQSALKAHCL